MNRWNRIVIFLTISFASVSVIWAHDQAVVKDDVIYEKITFKQSKEEEFEEIYRYRQQLEKDKSATEIREHLLSLKPSVTNADELISLPYLIKQCENSDPLLSKQFQDLFDTFQLLKNHMHISDEVEILFHLCGPSNERAQYVALYDLLDRNIYIMPSFFNRHPASRLFTLIHELVHALKHLQLGAIAYYYEVSFFDREHEADTYASQAITCPSCMHELENDYPKDKGDGYLTYADIVVCRNSKNSENLCAIHKIDSIENERLRSLLAIPAEMFTPEQVMEYIELTPLKDRLSTFTPIELQ